MSNKKQSVGISLCACVCEEAETETLGGADDPISLLLQVLKLELKEIRKQQDLLFRFMNFLKQEGAVHVLQFCLAVGEKNPVAARFGR